MTNQVRSGDRKPPDSPLLVRQVRRLTPPPACTTTFRGSSTGSDDVDCLRRVRALEEDGVIRGYHAELDPSKLGFSITVFAMVSLKSQAEDALREFEAAMLDLPEVREVHMLNGEIDFIIKIVSRDLQSFQEFLTSKLTPAPNVASVKTSLTIRTSKNDPGVPL